MKAKSIVQKKFRYQYLMLILLSAQVLPSCTASTVAKVAGIVQIFEVAPNLVENLEKTTKAIKRLIAEYSGEGSITNAPPELKMDLSKIIKSTTTLHHGQEKLILTPLDSAIAKRRITEGEWSEIKQNIEIVQELAISVSGAKGELEASNNERLKLLADLRSAKIPTTEREWKALEQISFAYRGVRSASIDALNAINNAKKQ